MTYCEAKQIAFKLLPEAGQRATLLSNRKSSAGSMVWQIRIVRVSHGFVSYARVGLSSVRAQDTPMIVSLRDWFNLTSVQRRIRYVGVP